MPSPTSWSSATNTTLSGSQTIDALLWGTQWVSSNLSYSFPGYVSTWSTSTATGYGQVSSGSEPWSISFAPLSVSQQTYFSAALQQWANVANLQFSLVADTSTNVGDIRAAFSYVSSFANAQAWSTTPGDSATAGDVWFNSISSSAIDPWTPGGFPFYTVLHELGHVLGFKHPFYEAGSSGAVLSSSLDTGQYTVMSYTEPPNDLFRTITYNANGSITLYTDHVSPETPMVLDIAAMQYLYGANTTYNTGDDVYSFDTATPFFRTIWDAGGNDTVSVGNFSQDCVIDLTPGNYSSIKILPEPIPAGYTVIGGITPTYDGTNNLGIAYGAIIENAVGGSGNDTLTGNDADNRLDGGAGNDTLTCGAGNDTVAGGSGNDVLYGNTGNDILYGNQDSDTLYGGQGADTLYGGQGADVLYGNLADDTMYGNMADDFMYGNMGGDIMYGGAGNDYLHGGQGNDQLFGNLETDTLVGGIGDDSLTGGGGADTFVFGANQGVDTIMDFSTSENDCISIASGTNGITIAEQALACVYADASGNAVVDLGGGNSVTLFGVGAPWLHVSDFVIL